MNMPTVLIVDDDRDVLATFSYILHSGGFTVHTAGSTEDALHCLSHRQCDIAIVDIHLGSATGVDLLRRLVTSEPFLQVILITGHPQVETASEAVRLGACDYLSKPILPNELLNAAHRALTRRRLMEQGERHRADLQAIFASLSDGVIMVDRTGSVCLSNDSYRHICGFLEDDGKLRKPEDRPPCAGVCLRSIQLSLANGVQQRLERFRCLRPDRQNQVVTLSTSPIRTPDGAINGIVLVLRDESRIEELESQLHIRRGFGRLVGSSPAMQLLYSRIETLADLPSTVLIQGESGTGKELVAEALHTTGNRHSRPFVRVNCSALSDTLLESELFGHVRGAFTGAVANRVGRFQRADGGTIFLDEIGDISPAMQMRLLRVLQEREFERVGDSTPLTVDVRVIAATNQDLLEQVRQGRFREDLYYRLNVVKLALPPLRDRMDDLEHLVIHFTERYAAAFSKPVSGISDAALHLFRSWHWPGNVRELQHVVEHAVILCRSERIDLCDLPQDLLHPQPLHFRPPSTPPPLSAPPLSIHEAIRRCNGNKAKAARLLGISRRTLYRHLEP
ncbi:sigma-54-dependent Fis family transcriptional regulator [Trichlorobacter ammonificans]|uniref:Sigma-54-dependent Fis family transcriptional regulator n=1 Tax=Trichlorobacter ammonificans TaxID=2916410 RepID=A0ABM9D7P4_9BACT|nr:sigma-54-dependent Fis family transcriptional regulator [Trichlorobacter ammonificans]CAH2031239.1 Sigma-54-dependent Fis family transcriptional regulator [Trichlorobacter ammonificans]